MGPTDSGPVAEPSRENAETAIPTGLPGPGIHVLDRFTNSYRKASSSRPTSYETHSVASQKQLEGTRITRKGDPNPQVPAPPFTMVAEGRQCTYRPAITPNITCLQIFTDTSIEGWGAHLGEHTERRTWSLLGSKLHINYIELKAVFLALKEFQDLCSNKLILVATNNTTVVSYINKEGGMRSGPLCALLWKILTCIRKQVTLKPDTFQAGRQATQARQDHPNRVVFPSRGLPINMQQVAPAQNRLICHEVQQQVASVCDTSTGSPGHSSGCTQSAMVGSGSIHLPTISHIGQSGGEKLQDSPCKRIILIAPG